MVIIFHVTSPPPPPDTHMHTLTHNLFPASPRCASWPGVSFIYNSVKWRHCEVVSGGCRQDRQTGWFILFDLKPSHPVLLVTAFWDYCSVILTLFHRCFSPYILTSTSILLFLPIPWITVPVTRAEGMLICLPNEDTQRQADISLEKSASLVGENTIQQFSVLD